MVATDTVVGIFGAVVLVAVMVGVFVYEYNNVETGGDDFTARYPALDPSEDLDGDGVANDEDPDMDGDGVPDVDDDAIATNETASGMVGPSVGPVSNQFSMEFNVGTGHRHVAVTVTGTPTADRPGMADFIVTIEMPDGTTGTASPSGETYTWEGSELEAGTYRVIVSASAGSVGGGIDAMAEVHYTA